MRRGSLAGALLGLWLAPGSALAQPGAAPPEPAPAAPPEPPQALPAPAAPLAPAAAPQAAEATSELLTPTPREWKLAYEAARAKLATGDFAGAAVKFAELERTAVNRVDRAIAHEQATLATDWALRGLAFVPQRELGETPASAKAVDKRTTDELVSLYTSAVLYGIGTGAWVGTLAEPKTPAAAILPTFALTGGAVGTVIGLDSGRGLRYGVAQSIVTGMNVGFGQGLVWSLWLAAQEDRAPSSKLVTSLIWSGATAGAILGGALGHGLGTTPGRSSWVGSTALWSGAVVGLGAGAFGGHGEASTRLGLAAAGIGTTVGTVVGLVTAGDVSPSIARVRFLDLGGILGGLLGAGLYIAAANESADGNATAGVAALGVAAGLVGAWALTSSMPGDKPNRPGDRPRATPAVLDRLKPMLMPASGGAMMGVGGSLD